jgi:hypothetical protein
VAAQTPQSGAILQYNGTSWNPTNTQTSATQNGYTYLPTGIIMQWGHVSGEGSTGTNSFPIPFPIPFPTACLNFMVSNADRQGGGIDNAYGYPIDSASFFANTKAGSNTTSGYPLYWFAIGY